MTNSAENTIATVVPAYYALVGSGPAAFDADRLAALLAPDLIFEGPIAGHRVGAPPFLKGVAGFAETARSIDMLHLLYAGDQAASLYDAQLPGGAVRFAEFFQVSDGRIRALRLLFDPALYRERGGR